MPYNLTTMQSIYHNQDEIVEITYNGSPVYQKIPEPSYDIRYTTTDNQKLTLHNSTGVASHEFSGRVGYITLTTNAPVPTRMFENCQTLATVKYKDGLTFDEQGYQHQYCYALYDVTLPSDLTAIPQRCFRYCTALYTMTVPSTVTSLGTYIWWKTGLDRVNEGQYQPEIKFTSAVPPVASDIQTFITSEPNTQPGEYNTIYKLVPYETYSDYCTAQYWKETNSYIDWYDDDDTDYESMPFYVENNSDVAKTVTFKQTANIPETNPPTTYSLYSSTDKINWTLLGVIPDDINNISVTLQPSDRVYLKYEGPFGIRVEGGVTVGGNLTSMSGIEPVDGIMPKTTVVARPIAMFRKSSGKDGVVDARNLVTKYINNSASTGSDPGNSYNTMFGDHQGGSINTDLVYAPKYMYLHSNDTGEFMGTFAGCTSLTHAPKLIGDSCGWDVFWKTFMGCTSLVAAVIPNITTVYDDHQPGWAGEVFNYMFDGCSSLKYLKNSTITKNMTSSGSVSSILSGVAQDGCYVKNLSDSNYPASLPSSWTKLNATE